jgi:hypothetical protein
MDSGIEILARLLAKFELLLMAVVICWSTPKICMKKRQEPCWFMMHRFCSMTSR